MKSITRFVVLFVIAFSFVHCQKELGFEGTPDPTPTIPEIIHSEPIQANLQGNILDENEQPAVGVTIKVGSKTATTDASGYFRITNAELDKKTSLVAAEKSGYFKGYRVFGATSGTNHIVIKLVKRMLAGTIVSTAGGDATLSDGTKITLPADGIVTASSNAAYTGDVKVYANYIDPSQTDIGIRVPGSFLANDKDGKRVLLTSYGMVAVVLESPVGDLLQIKSGATATLTTPIPASAISTAPSGISLWSVDEATGIWKEEGTAIKQGDKYVGTVSHFSFWNCDVSTNSISLTFTLHNSDSTPLVHVPVKITRSGTGWQTVGWGYTDSLGMVSGAVPSNETLQVEVLDACYNTAFDTTVGPLTQSTDLGIITVPNATTSLVSFEGTLVNCSGGAVINGYAVIGFNNTVRYASVDSNGHFSIAFFTCSTVSATILGVDLGTQQQGSAGTVNITLPVTNAGNITACGTTSAQFITYNLDGTYYSITSTANDSLSAWTSSTGTINPVTYIMGDGIGTKHFYITAENVSTQVYWVQTIQVQSHYQTTLVPPFNITFTHFAATAGDFYEGTFAGIFSDSAIQHNVNGTFKVKRSF